VNSDEAAIADRAPWRERRAQRQGGGSWKRGEEQRQALLGRGRITDGDRSEQALDDTHDDHRHG
jgi:hypothetical protein